jgi:hypothetical protein
MGKKLFFLIGLLTGALLIELFYRPLKARLKAAEAVAAENERFNAFIEKDQQDYYDSLSTEKKIAYTLAMAEDWDGEEVDDGTEE